MSFAAPIPVQAILDASRRAEVLAAVEDLYRSLDAEIAALNPTCWNSGACCRFGEYGHRLYVTTLEAAYYWNRAGEDIARRGDPPGECSDESVSTLREITSITALPILTAPPGNNDPASDVCPHARERACQVRPRRPMGCRIFFCDPAAEPWQGPLTERCLTRMRQLHEDLQVPYCYADWMRVLAALDAARP